MDPVSPQPSPEPVVVTTRQFPHPRVWGGIVIILLIVAVGVYAYMHPSSAGGPSPMVTASSTDAGSSMFLPLSAMHWVPATAFHTSLHYATDCTGNYWYDDGKIGSCEGVKDVAGADASTFEVLQSNDTSISLNPAFARDSAHVWANEHELTGADPATAQPMYTQSQVRKKGTDYQMVYVTDKNHVWWNDGSLIAGADVSSFTPIYTSNDYAGFTAYLFLYFKDTSHVWGNLSYYGPPVLLPDADPATFAYVGTIPSGGVGEPSLVFTKDKNHVYLNDKVFFEADPATFTMLTSSSSPNLYSLDKDNVYAYDAIVPGADPSTFILIPGGDDGDSTTDAKDKNHTYHFGEVVE